MTQPALGILVMDDELDLIAPIAAGLQRRGFQCTTVSSLTDGLTQLQQKTFDLLLSDLRMPGGGAIELLRALKAQRIKAPPTLIMTGLIEINLAEAFSIGVCGLLKKPFDRNSLIEALHSVLLPISEKWKPNTSSPSSAPSLHLNVRSPNLETALDQGEIRVGLGGFVAPIGEASTSGDSAVQIPIKWGQGKTGQIHGILRWIETRQDHKRLGGVEFTSMPDEVKMILMKIGQIEKQTEFIPRSLA